VDELTGTRSPPLTFFCVAWSFLVPPSQGRTFRPRLPLLCINPSAHFFNLTWPCISVIFTHLPFSSKRIQLYREPEAYLFSLPDSLSVRRRHIFCHRPLTLNQMSLSPPIAAFMLNSLVPARQLVRLFSCTVLGLTTYSFPPLRLTLPFSATPSLFPNFNSLLPRGRLISLSLFSFSPGPCATITSPLS